MRRRPKACCCTRIKSLQLLAISRQRKAGGFRFFGATLPHPTKANAKINQQHMWPFPKTRSYPGVQKRANGEITFSLTEEEARETDLALSAFKGLLVHPEAAERVRNGTIAAALSRYAKDLITTHCLDVTESEYETNRRAIEDVIEKAVAAEWKAFSLYPLPVFLYHRACFLRMLGISDESKLLFASFLRRHSEFEMDDVDKAISTYEGSDISQALSHASEEI